MIKDAFIPKVVQKHRQIVLLVLELAHHKKIIIAGLESPTFFIGRPKNAVAHYFAHKRIKIKA